MKFFSASAVFRANTFYVARLAAFVGLGLLLFLFVFTSFYLIWLDGEEEVRGGGREGVSMDVNYTAQGRNGPICKWVESADGRHWHGHPDGDVRLWLINGLRGKWNERKNSSVNRGGGMRNGGRALMTSRRWWMASAWQITMAYPCTHTHTSAQREKLSFSGKSESDTFFFSFDLIKWRQWRQKFETCLLLLLPLLLLLLRFSFFICCCCCCFFLFEYPSSCAFIKPLDGMWKRQREFDNRHWSLDRSPRPNSNHSFTPFRPIFRTTIRFSSVQHLHDPANIANRS